MKNDELEVVVTNYGCTIVKVLMKDKNGEVGDVVLGYDNIESYQNLDAYLGALVGRVANRIKVGKFSLNGEEYTLAVNNGPNHLHGGIKGFSYQTFNYEIKDENSIEFSYEALTNAIAEAVEKEAAHGADRVTDQVQAPAIYADEQSYDFKGMMDEFQEIVGKLVQKSPNMAGKITLIVDKHLGKGKKVSDCTAANAPQLDLILYELRELNK